jgi:hypothetical protein
MSMSCVAFLRQLFPNDCFESEKKYGLQLKQLKAGKSAKSDRFIGYIEKGCFDALSRKYLKSIVLSVSIERDNPNVCRQNLTVVDYRDIHMDSVVSSRPPGQ